MSLALRSSLALIVTLTLAAGPAQAAPGDAAANQARAEELNKQGKTKIKELDLEGAAKFFREALALYSDPRYAFNLCYTLEKAGYLPEAERHCRYAQDHGEQSVVYKATQILKRIRERKQNTSPTPTPPGSQPPGAPPPRVIYPPYQVPIIPPQKPKEPKLRYGGWLGFTDSIDGDGNNAFNLGGGVTYESTGRYSFVATGELLERGVGSRFGDIPTTNLLYLDLAPSVRFAIFGGSFYLEGGLNVGIRLYVDSEEVLLDETNFFHYGFSLGTGLALPIGSHLIDLRFRIISSISDIVETTDSEFGDTRTDGANTFSFGAGLWW